MTPNRVQAKRKASVLEVPPAGEDPAERKRALNVLAQRRYRQRQKEHVKKLEAQVTHVEVDASEPQTVALSRRDVQDATPTTGTSGPVPEVLPLESLFEPDPHDGEPFVGNSHTSSAEYSSMPYQDTRVDIVQQGQHLFEDDPFAAFDETEIAPLSGVEWDSDFFLPSLDSTSTLVRSQSSQSGSSTLLPSPIWSGGSPVPNPAAGHDKSVSHTSRRQQNAGDGCSFADEALLDMPQLALLRGCMSIARRMNIEEIMWSLDSTSPFTGSGSPTQFTHLPTNLRPTVTQMTVPHHPAIDLLPWPSARDKMIMVLSQPPEIRPPRAASPMALVDFIYDLEDDAEGVRIAGDDPYSSQNWEVGEKLFKSWWWMLDRDIVRRSNELRTLRGAPMLGCGSILGEVG
ncbi:hypothetical protein PV11_07627 [Exophiala sideris]|uniref:BZIP domain-containing protein n=1 Tax=Exophiala sideris TaxID=1016849 RepID=A0A0D1VV58_9EURO|nr:hypothetical protein PV11_07627 [Exophiala sideris]